MLGEMEKDIDKMTNQAKFIEMIIDGKLIVSKKSKKALVEELHSKGFKPIPKIVDARKQGEFEPVVEDEAEGVDEHAASSTVGSGDFDYLLGVGAWHIDTMNRIDYRRCPSGL